MQQRTILLIVLLGCFLQSFGQDRHFSQFFAAPINLNPALTGAYNGSYRVSAIYRDQWRGVLDNPIVTYAATMDARFEVEKNSAYKDAFAFGLLFFKDNVASIDLSTNQIMLSAAYHKGLDYDSKQFLSVGIQGGLAQRNVNYEKLFFEDQFNALDGYIGESIEDLPANNFSFADLNVGLNYTIQISKKSTLIIGGAMHHVLRPRTSFYYKKDDPETSQERLYSKYSGQLSAVLGLSDKVSLIPRALFSLQGPHMRLNAGTNVRMKLNRHNSNALQIGAWVRPVRTESSPI